MKDGLKIEEIKKMLTKNIKVEEIAKKLKLPVKKVEEIKNSMGGR